MTTHHYWLSKWITNYFNNSSFQLRLQLRVFWNRMGGAGRSFQWIATCSKTSTYIWEMEASDVHTHRIPDFLHSEERPGSYVNLTQIAHIYAFVAPAKSSALVGSENRSSIFSDPHSRLMTRHESSHFFMRVAFSITQTLSFDFVSVKTRTHWAVEIVPFRSYIP